MELRSGRPSGQPSQAHQCAQAEADAKLYGRADDVAGSADGREAGGGDREKEIGGCLSYACQILVMKTSLVALFKKKKTPPC